MSEPIPESIPTATSRLSHRPTKKAKPSGAAISAQSHSLAVLFANADREITIPPSSKDATITKQSALAAAPEIVPNVQGSSAGAGSGEFHVYKASRRREYERLKAMDEEVQKEEDEREWEKRKAEGEKKEEKRMNKNKARRDKAKERKAAAAASKKDGVADGSEGEGVADGEATGSNGTGQVTKKIGLGGFRKGLWAGQTRKAVDEANAADAEDGDAQAAAEESGLTIVDDED